MLAKLSSDDVKATELAGEQIRTVLTEAPGNGAPIGGVKVVAENGWFAARPSGTEDIYKLYAESMRGRSISSESSWRPKRSSTPCWRPEKADEHWGELSRAAVTARWSQWFWCTV